MGYVSIEGRSPASSAEMAIAIDRFAELVNRWRLGAAEADALLDRPAGGAAALLIARSEAGACADRLRNAVSVDLGMLLLLGGEDDLREWLRSPSAVLGHREPLERMCDRAGGLGVVAALVRAEIETLAC